MPGHTDTEDLEQYISGQLSESDSAIVQAHLEACEECQLKLADIAMDVQWKGPERRKEPRVRVSFAGRLKLLDPILQPIVKEINRHQAAGDDMRYSMHIYREVR